MSTFPKVQFFADFSRKLRITRNFGLIPENGNGRNFPFYCFMISKVSKNIHLAILYTLVNIIFKICDRLSVRSKVINHLSNKIKTIPQILSFAKKLKLVCDCLIFKNNNANDCNGTKMPYTK